MSQIENTLVVGKVLIQLNECNSTNRYVKELIAKSKPIEGTVVLAANQTDGKGQIGNTWISEPGKNLTFSIVLFPHFLQAQEQFLLSQICSLALVDAIEAATGLSIKIKWPNDLFCNNRKIAGILIENQLQGHNIQQAILGIGLNVNQLSFDNLPQASSLQLELGHEIALEAILNAICQRLDRYYLKLKSGKTDEVRKSYIEKLLGIHELREFDVNGVRMKGSVTGVSKEGLLEVVHSSVHQQYNFKEIAWVFPKKPL